MEKWATNLGLSDDHVAYLRVEEFDLPVVAALSFQALVEQLDNKSKPKLKLKEGPKAKLRAAHSVLVKGERNKSKNTSTFALSHLLAVSLALVFT